MKMLYEIVLIVKGVHSTYRRIQVPAKHLLIPSQMFDSFLNKPLVLDARFRLLGATLCGKHFRKRLNDNRIGQEKHVSAATPRFKQKGSKPNLVKVVGSVFTRTP